MPRGGGGGLGTPHVVGWAIGFGILRLSSVRPWLWAASEGRPTALWVSMHNDPPHVASHAAHRAERLATWGLQHGATCPRGHLAIFRMRPKCEDRDVGGGGMWMGGGGGGVMRWASEHLPKFSLRAIRKKR